MRIAIVDHVSAGGVSRFAANLVDGLLEREEVESLTYFVSSSNIQRDRLDLRWCDHAKLELVPIKGAMDDRWLWEASSAARVASAAHRFLSRLPGVHAAVRSVYRYGRRSLRNAPPESAWYHYKLDEATITRLAAFDVVYLAWPFFLEPFECGAPVVATFHDFHFEHFPEVYPEEQLALARRQTREWLSRAAIAVTSTEFIGSEIDEFFPGTSVSKRVVYLAPYTKADPAASEDAAVLAACGVCHPFVIYSGGTSAHKNVLGLFTALSSLDPVDRPQLVITGIGTERIDTGVPPDDPLLPVNLVIRQAKLRSGTDFLGLGYVSDRVVDELTRAADLVISASKYEAGCGPALDAWQLGAPVAFSNIPSFVEQTRRFGVEAVVFDPTDVDQIAAALRRPVTDPEGLRAMARRSQTAMLAYDWRRVADGYLDVFQQAIALGTSGSSYGEGPV